LLFDDVNIQPFLISPNFFQSIFNLFFKIISKLNTSKGFKEKNIFKLFSNKGLKTKKPVTFQQLAIKSKNENQNVETFRFANLHIIF